MFSLPARYGRVFFLALVALAAQAQTWGPSPGTQPAYSLVYTGKLFGYFRYPDIQTSADRGCPDVAATPLPPQVQQFQAALQRLHSPTQELVSMGENFAPELLSRSVRNEMPGTLHYRELVSKDVIVSDRGRVLSDNVACFFRLMGFDAMVPGQQDFYYGPERLRQLARFLASPATPSYQPVQMLAANLIIGSAVRYKNPPLPNSRLPQAIQLALSASSPVHFDLPSAVMPWLPEVAVTGTASRLTIYDCPATPDNPKDFQLPFGEGNHCTLLPESTASPLAFRFARPASPSQNFLPYYSLDPGSNHALCAVFAEGDSRQTRCQLFSVQYPFFQFQPVSAATTPAPYFIPPNPNAAVVFGIVDPSLVGYIGQLSDVWMNNDHRFDTRADVIDPIEALRQVLQLCDSDKSCRGRRKVLLAQMPYYKASQVASRLKVFDVVIAQPDLDHATGNETISRTGNQNVPYVLAPGISFDAARDNPLSTNLRRVDYYSENSAQRFFANHVLDAAIKVDTGARCRTCSLDREVAQMTGAADNQSKSYEELALTSMQQFCGSDIALLQHRDIFSSFGKAVKMWPASFQPAPQQLLDELLWKGDFAFCVPVSGSTLKKVMSESDAFDKQDQDNLSIEVEKGRGLSTLGLQRDESGTLFIRGQQVQDNKLYGVGMTDYLAFGNTGYPELASEAIQPVVRLVSLKSLNRLTGLACEKLPKDFTRNSCQSDEISASDYFAAIRQRPFDTTRGLTAWLEFRDWATHPLQSQPNATTFVARKTDVPENVVERRGLWWFTLQNLSFGYNLNFIKGSDRTVPGNFVGNNNFSQLSTPESSLFSFWGRARGGYSFPRYLDFYASAEVKYSRLSVRNSISNGNFGDYQLTLGNNLLRGETGLTTKPLTGRIPIRLLASENLLTQIAQPFQQFTAPVPCGVLPCNSGATGIANYPLAKSYLVLTRVGARIQNDQSWLEAGREYGENIDIPASYALQDPARPAPLMCDLAKGVTLSSCVSNDPLFTTQSTILPQLHNQKVAGWFLNFHSAVPLYRSRLQLLVDSYGELFDRERDDTVYNTRFYEDLTLALRVPIWGNLTFAPQVETFFYQSKVLPDQFSQLNHYVFVTTSVTLQYAFDWHRGVGLLRAFRFPNGISTNTSATVPRP